MFRPIISILSKGLGLTGLGIGLAELVAPRQVQSLLGLTPSARYDGVLRVLGLRETLHGVSILTPQSRPTLRADLWARSAGDLLDSSLLGFAALRTKQPARFATIAGAVLAIGALDVLCARRLMR